MILGGVALLPLYTGFLQHRIPARFLVTPVSVQESGEYCIIICRPSTCIGIGYIILFFVFCFLVGR